MVDLKIFILASDPLARAGLSLMVSSLNNTQVVGQSSSADAVAETGDVAPDVVLWDLGWEPQSELPDVTDLPAPVLALIPDAEEAATAWAAGVRGLLHRECDAAMLAAALEAVLQDLTVVEPAFMPHIIGGPAGSIAGPDEPLTPRELEVLKLLAEGVTNRAISLDLNISEHTVKFHVNAIMHKLGAQSRTEAVVLATRMGLISL